VSKAFLQTNPLPRDEHFSPLFYDCDGLSEKWIANQASGERSRKFMRLVRGAGFVLLAIVISLIGIWCSIGIWYQCRTYEPLRGFLTGANP
jgi:hypothetical protein